MRVVRYILCLGSLTLAVACSEDANDDPGGATTMGVGTVTGGTAANTGATNSTATGTVGATSTGTVGGTATATGTANSTSGTTGGAGGTGGMPAGSLPVDPSAASITAFLQDSGYTDQSWLSIYAAPEESPSHAGNVRVYMSPALVAWRQQNTDLLVEPDAAGVMAVKELYDDAQTVVGHAVTYYPEQGSLYYYCYGPAAFCPGAAADTTMAEPAWGEPLDNPVSQCRFCHGGNVFTELPE